MLDKVLVEVGSEGRGEGAGGSGCCGIGGSGGRVGRVAAAAAAARGDVVGTWGGTPLTAATQRSREAR